MILRIVTTVTMAFGVAISMFLCSIKLYFWSHTTGMEVSLLGRKIGAGGGRWMNGMELLSVPFSF